MKRPMTRARPLDQPVATQPVLAAQTGRAFRRIRGLPIAGSGFAANTAASQG